MGHCFVAMEIIKGVVAKAIIAIYYIFSGLQDLFAMEAVKKSLLLSKCFVAMEII